MSSKDMLNSWIVGSAVLQRGQHDLFETEILPHAQAHFEPVRMTDRVRGCETRLQRQQNRVYSAALTIFQSAGEFNVGLSDLELE